MSGQVFTCLASFVRASARSASPSTARAPSMTASWVCLRRRSVPSLPASSRGSSTFCTLIPKCRNTSLSRLGSRLKLTPVGGGGTDFRPCFSWLGDHGIQPQTMVFLTDLVARFQRECHPTLSFGHRRPPGKHPLARSFPWRRHEPEIGRRRPNSLVLAICVP